MTGAFSIVGVYCAYELVRSFFPRSKPKPKAREVVIKIGFDARPMTESLRKANESMRRMGEAMRLTSYHNRMRQKYEGPPAILCSACGETLERTADRFNCIGCGREVKP
jgi:hypothetical protein